MQEQPSRINALWKQSLECVCGSKSRGALAAVLLHPQAAWLGDVLRVMVHGGRDRFSLFPEENSGSLGVAALLPGAGASTTQGYCPGLRPCRHLLRRDSEGFDSAGEQLEEPGCRDVVMLHLQNFDKKLLDREKKARLQN